VKLALALSPFHARRLLVGLIAVDVCFAAIALAKAALGNPGWILDQLFDLDRELTIPAWFSSSQLFVIGLALLVKSRLVARGSTPSPLVFLIAGAGFLYLSMDETAAIHERLSATLQNVSALPRFSGGHGVWTSLYVGVALALVLVNLRGVIALWRRYRRPAALLGLEVVAEEFLEMLAPASRCTGPCS
jgi:hypothetical protein